MEVEGKAAVVSGGASGIGRATVLALVERGAKVFAEVNEDGGRLTVHTAGEEDGVAVFRRGALQYRLQYEALDMLQRLYYSFTFYLQICTFVSGADGILTHDLRRAKSRYIVLRDLGPGCSKQTNLSEYWDHMHRCAYGLLRIHLSRTRAKRVKGWRHTVLRTPALQRWI